MFVHNPEKSHQILKELRTDRIRLLPFNKSDLILFHECLTNKVIRKYLLDDDVIELDTAKEMLKKSTGYFRKASYGLWKIESLKNGKFMGFAGFWFFFEEKYPQLCYAVMQEFCGSGIATETAALLLHYAFEDLKFPYVMATCNKENTVSQRVAEKAGMSFTETKNINGNDLMFYRINNPALRSR